MITKCAKRLFSAYRRDDFAEPDGFVLQLGLVLEPYPDSVIDEVTSPRTGLQRRLKFPPSIAEVVEACDAADAYQKRMEALRKVRPVERKSLPRPPRDPRAKANHFIPEGFVGYDEAVSRHEAAGKASVARFETRSCLDGVERYGIWTPYDPSGGDKAWPKKGLKLYTAQEIIDRYKPSAPVEQAAE